MTRTIVMGLVLAFAGTAEATDSPKPLAELAKQLRNPDREKRLVAVEAIRDHYKGKSLDALPQLLLALGEELNRPHGLDTGQVIYLESTLWQTVDMVGAGRLKVIRESTRHTDPLIRAAAFRAWMGAAFDKDTELARDEFLAIVRQGLKDDSALVRGQAVTALHAFRDWPPSYVAQPGFKDAPAAVRAEVVSLLIAALDDHAKKYKGDAHSPATQAVLVLNNFQAEAKPAIPALTKMAAVNDIKDYVRGTCETLKTIAVADPDTAEEIVKTLQPLLADKTRSNILRACAVSGVIGVGPAARWVASDLADILEEPGANYTLRNTTYTALYNMGPRAAPAVPTLIRLLERGAQLERRQKALAAHRALGSSAVWQKDWDWFVQVVDDRRRVNAPPGTRTHIPFAFDYHMADAIAGEQSWALGTLGAIGPAAASAADPIEKWMDQTDDPVQRMIAFKALRAIKK